MVSRCCEAKPAPEDRNKGASPEAPLSMGCKGRLKIELERKLDLPRIIRVGSSGPNFAEGGTGVVARSTDGHNAVATEIRSVEGWMVGNVKEFGPELQVDIFLDGKILKD